MIVLDGSDGGPASHSAQRSDGSMSERLGAAAGRVRRGLNGFLRSSLLAWDEEVPLSSLQVVEKLGEGGFAVVEKAWYTPPSGDKKLVALKRLRPELYKRPNHFAMFAKEIALARKLRHTNIVKFVGAGAGAEKQDPKTTFFLQELMQGGTLRGLVMRQMLNNPNALYSDAAAVDICAQVARALRYMHMARPMVIHRDLKLDNVLLTTKDPDPETGLFEAKLGDFGLSTAVAVLHQRPADDEIAPRSASWNNLSGPPETSGGLLPRLEVPYSLPLPTLDLPGPDGKGAGGLWDTQFKAKLAEPRVPCNERFALTSHTGSLMYMAPEVFRKETYNDKADVFSFGVIMYEVLHKYMMLSIICVTGTESDVEAYAQSVSNGYRPPIHDHWPQPVKDLIRACWAADPLDRPSMNEVVVRLGVIQQTCELCKKHVSPRAYGNCCVVS